MPYWGEISVTEGEVSVSERLWRLRFRLTKKIGDCSLGDWGLWCSGKRKISVLIGGERKFQCLEGGRDYNSLRGGEIMKFGSYWNLRQLLLLVASSAASGIFPASGIFTASGSSQLLFQRLLLQWILPISADSRA